MTLRPRMQTRRRLSAAAAVLALLGSVAAACGGAEADTPSSAGHPTATLIVHTTGGTAKLHVEVADSQAERARGLMDRTQLAPDAGMAFVWDEAEVTSFWMKDTLIPLSAVFWDDRGRIVWTGEMRPCAAEPCRTYGPDVPAIGAAEANAGWFDAHGVRVGDRVVLDGVP
jgi:uncharacterized membrane protein (UPF0127 family)